MHKKSVSNKGSCVFIGYSWHYIHSSGKSCVSYFLSYNCIATFHCLFVHLGFIIHFWSFYWPSDLQGSWNWQRQLGWSGSWRWNADRGRPCRHDWSLNGPVPGWAALAAWQLLRNPAECTASTFSSRWTRKVIWKQPGKRYGLE